MTLIVTVPARDCVVVASDGQVTAGPVRWETQKIHPLGRHRVWAGAGSLAVIQRVQIALREREPAPLEVCADDLGRLVAGCTAEALTLDLRAHIRGGETSALEEHSCEFIFVQGFPTPAVLHVPCTGVPEWVSERPFAIGSGAPFAFTLLHSGWDRQITGREALVLVYRAMEEAIRTASFGLSGPIDIWVLSPAGVKRLGQRKMARLRALTEQFRRKERDVLARFALSL